MYVRARRPFSRMLEKVVFPAAKDGKLTFGRLGSLRLGRSKAGIRVLGLKLCLFGIGVGAIEGAGESAAAAASCASSSESPETEDGGE